MRVFNCDHCGHLVFDSVQCLHCGNTLFLCLTSSPWLRWRLRRRTGWAAALGERVAVLHRLIACAKLRGLRACNFAVPANDYSPLCVSCRQTRVLPDFVRAHQPGALATGGAAKRQLFYTLARLGLEPGRAGHPVFEFRADWPGGPQVLTGHQGGTITLNVAEADDDERARRRIALGEPYRTLIGHLRHESGHFYWDQLVQGGARLEEFRRVFGDERADYAAALQAHYARGMWGRGLSGMSAPMPLPTLGRLGRNLGPLPAHGGFAGDGRQLPAGRDGAHAAIRPPARHAPHRVRPFGSPAPSFDDMVGQWVPVTCCSIA